jgi:hypothetical protein
MICINEFGLMQFKKSPTRDANVPDLIFVYDPLTMSDIRVDFTVIWSVKFSVLLKQCERVNKKRGKIRFC